jgi:HEAT repeat protein
VASLKELLDDLVSGDEERAEAAIPHLIEMDADAVPALLELTQSQDVDTRWWALRALASTPQARTEWLVPFLNDPAPEIRQCAALGLAIKPDESATESLVRALSDKDSMVNSLAANALIKIGKAAVPSLIEAVKRRPAIEGSVEGTGPQSQRIHALRALAEIRDHRAIQVMMQVMQEDSALLQHWAQEGLERLGLDMIYMKPL